MTVALVSTSPTVRAAAARPTPSVPSAADVLKALRGDRTRAQGPGAMRSFVAALLTFGIYPLVRWAIRFDEVVSRDRAALTRLADWSRGRLPELPARALTHAADRVRPSVWASPGGWLLIAPMLLAFFWTVEGVIDRRGLWSAVIGSTFGFRPAGLTNLASPVTQAFLLWTIGLSAAYGVHLVQVHLHARAVRRFLDEFNRTVAVEEGFPPVLLEPIGLGFSPMWVLAAGTLLFLNAWWAVPFAMTGATDRRYRRRASVRMRRDLADRVRDLIFASPELSRPVVRVPVDAVRCATPGCGGPLGPRAKFCPRCGTRRGRSGDPRGVTVLLPEPQ